MLQKYKTIYKTVGQTPLEAIEALRKEVHIPKDVPLAYAGRLDPMAEGKLLVLIGDECKNQKAYHGLDKEYVVEVLLGIESDSMDVLGIVEKHTTVPKPTRATLEQIVAEYVGEITLPYPVFSSKTVNGKPLFLWQLEGRINEVEIPKKTSTIHAIKLLDVRTISMDVLLPLTRTKIDAIKPVTEETKRLGADFRRDEVRAAWDRLQKHAQNERFTVATLKVTASSGTYMRSLADSIAQKLDTRGLALSIQRTKIGRYVRLFGTIGVWIKKY